MENSPRQRTERSQGVQIAPAVVKIELATLEFKKKNRLMEAVEQDLRERVQ
jgi:hypothetical protein